LGGIFPAFFVLEILTYAWYAAVSAASKVAKSPHPKAIFPFFGILVLGE
jgi:hypothetical protein